MKTTNNKQLTTDSELKTRKDSTMKSITAFTLAIFATLILCTANLVAAPIQGTGWTKDCIVEAGASNPNTATNHGLLFAPVEVGYAGDGGSIPPTGYGTGLTITGNTVTTKSGTVFSVNPTANNTIFGNNTFTLTTPKKYEDLQFLVYGEGGPFSATINFADLSSTILTATLNDWQTGGSIPPNIENAFATKTAHIRTDNLTYFSNGLYMRELSFDLAVADQAKTITSIYFSLSGSNSLGVTGISGTPIPEPSTAILAGLGLAGLCLRRRR